MAIQAKIAGLQTEIEQKRGEIQILMDEIWNAVDEIEVGTAALQKDRSEYDSSIALSETAEKTRILHLNTLIDRAAAKTQALSALAMDHSRIQEIATKKQYGQLKKAVRLYGQLEAFHEHYFDGVYPDARKTIQKNLKVSISYGAEPSQHCLTRNANLQFHLGISHSHQDVAKGLGFIEEKDGKWKKV